MIKFGKLYDRETKGPTIERELFGKTSKEKEGYVKYKEAMDIVRKSQPYKDPSEPDPEFADDLHATVADSLELEEYKKLKLFTAVGSHLDVYHGVDAFIELEDENMKVICTIDVTTNPNKDVAKADVLFHFPITGLDPKLDRDEYLEKVREVANKIVEDINFKLGNKN
jgi:hypothetical protein